MTLRMKGIAQGLLSVLLAIVLAAGLLPVYSQSAAADEGASQPFDDAEEPVLYSNGAADDEADDDASSDDGQDAAGDSALSTLSTTAEELSSGGTYITIDSSEFSSSWIEGAGSDIVANEAQNGLYLLYGTRLLFFSLDDYSCSVKYVFSKASESYMTDGALYVLNESSGAVIYEYDLDAQGLSGTVDVSAVYDEDGVSDITAIGADGEGRLYLATDGTLDGEEVYQLWLFSADGELLSSASIDVYVNSFAGFADDGSFFMETEYNWVYWGYDHYGNAATMGCVDDDQISFTQTSGSVTISGLLTYSLSCIEYLCQYSYYYHEKAADVIGGQYLVTSSTTYGRLIVWEWDDSTISAVISLSRDAIEQDQDDTYTDENSVGVRTVYNEADDSIVVYENGNVLNEYDPESGEIIGTYSTQHCVYSLMTMGDTVVALEMEDGDYYIELIEWVAPEAVELVADSTTMKVGESQQLGLSSESSFLPGYEWDTSDASIVSVTDEGVVSAWREGTATISFASEDGSVSATLDITVSGTTVTGDTESYALSGASADNASDNNYTVWSSTMDSYLYEADDGSLVRVEYTDGAVLVETYTAAGVLTGSKSVTAELSVFGGFYAGEDYNYLVFGQSNYGEDDSVEVVRVVKYTKGWTRVAACSIYGANTYYPFDAGSLRMVETGGNLYVYTCHTMWSSTSGDGTNHQANMTLVIDEDSMTYVDGYYEIMNIAQAGYVSHSFNQFIATDGEYIYRVDHGDGAPRAVSITKADVDDDVTDVTYTYALSIQGSYGANATGVSVGGMALSDQNVLIVGNSVDQSDSDTYSASGQRNIFLTVTDQTYLSTDTIWLTDYSSSDGVTPRTPQLVKLSDDQFLIMWEEYSSSGSYKSTRLLTVNGDGDITSNTCTSTLRLSDCQPILTSDGLVAWYAGEGDDATLYTLDPFDVSGAFFTDVLDLDKYYFDAVYALAANGYVTGTTTTTFAPTTTLTRAQMVAVLWRIYCPEEYAELAASNYAGSTNTTAFTDVADNKYYTAAVEWAVAEGIAKGTSTTTFSPNQTCTFQEYCTFLARALAGGDAAVTAAYSDSAAAKVLAGFSDSGKIASYADNSIAYCVANGLVSGYTDGTIRPTEKTARGRMATLVYRAIENGLLA